MRIPRPQPSQLGVGALVVAALAVGQLLNDHLPDDGVTARPFLVDVAEGEEAALRAGDLEVTSVEGAPSYVDGTDGFVSPGLFVVVSFTWTAQGEPGTIRYGELRTTSGDVTRLMGNGERSEVVCPGAPVGLPARCYAAVEADPDQLVGARLRLGVDHLDERYDAMADVDLQVSAADVDAWSARTDPLAAPAEDGAA